MADLYKEDYLRSELKEFNTLLKRVRDSLSVYLTELKRHDNLTSFIKVHGDSKERSLQERLNAYASRVLGKLKKLRSMLKEQARMGS